MCVLPSSAIETQKEADAAERRDIGVLRSTQASLTSQRANLEGDLQELEKVSKAKAKAKEEKRNMLIMQRSKNVGELQRLYNLTGLEIRQHKIQGESSDAVSCTPPGLTRRPPQYDVCQTNSNSSTSSSTRTTSTKSTASSWIFRSGTGGITRVSLPGSLR